MSAILIVAAMAGADPGQCRRTHYTADGRVIRSTVTADGTGASASSSARGSGPSSSSVSSSSSSSSSSGDGSSSATSTSVVDGVRRTTSVTRDASGCTITVDDRPTKE